MFFKGSEMSNPDEYKDKNQNGEFSETGEFENNEAEYGASDGQNSDYADFDEYDESNSFDQEYVEEDAPADGSYEQTEYAEGDAPADGAYEQTEYAEGDAPADGAYEQTEYAEDDAPADGAYEQPEYAEDEVPDENAPSTGEEEPKEEKLTLFQKIRNADRYTVVLFLSLTILFLGVLLILIRLGVDYNFIIQPKFNTEGFGFYQQNGWDCRNAWSPVLSALEQGKELLG